MEVEEAARCEFIKETGITLHPDSVHPLALWQAQVCHTPSTTPQAHAVPMLCVPHPTAGQQLISKIIQNDLLAVIPMLGTHDTVLMLVQPLVCLGHHLS